MIKHEHRQVMSIIKMVEQSIQHYHETHHLHGYGLETLANT